MNNLINRSPRESQNSPRVRNDFVQNSHNYSKNEGSQEKKSQYPSRYQDQILPKIQQNSAINNSDSNKNNNHQKGQSNNQSESTNQITKFSNLIYILGPVSEDLLFFIENSSKTEKQSANLIEKMMAYDFIKLQSNRIQRIMNIFQQFIVDTILNQQKEKDGMKEIGYLMKKELASILKNYDAYIKNQEDNLKKIQLFQNKEVILVTEFYDGVQIVLDSYKYLFKEMNSYGVTRPEQSLYVKSLSQFKTLLKSNEKNFKAYKLIDDLENQLKSQFELIEFQKSKIEKYTQENQHLTDICMKLQNDKQDWNLEKTNMLKGKENNEDKQEQDLMKKYGIKKQTENNEINLVHLKALEDFYIKTVHELKEENQRLNKQYQSCNKKLQIMQQLHVFQESEKERKKTQEQKDFEKLQQQKILDQNRMATKELQCSFINNENPISKRETQFSLIIKDPNQFLKTVSLFQQKQWVQYIINVIYQDKIFADIYDEIDQRPSQNFNDFVCQWFLMKFFIINNLIITLLKQLKRFGNKEIGEAMLKDFLLVLKKQGKQIQRFKTFCQFCNLEEFIEIDAETVQNTVGLDKIKFRRAFMSSQEPLKFYLKAAYLVKMSNTTFHGGNNQFMPLLPNIMVRGSDLISFEIVQKIFELLIEENYEKIDLQNIEQHYRKFLTLDMIERSKDSLQVYNNLTEDDEDQYIRFDILCINLIEMILEQRYFELENIHHVLQLKSASKQEASIFFEDYQNKIIKLFPNKSKRWLSVTYKEIIDGILSDKTTLATSLLKIIPYLSENDCIKQNIIKIKTDLFKTQKKAGDVNDLQNQQDNNEEQKKQQRIQQLKQIKSIKSNQITITQQSKINQNSIVAQIQEKQIFSQELLEIEKEKIKTVFDPINEICLLQETYKIFQSQILISEKKNDNLNINHLMFQEEFKQLPANLQQQQNFEVLNEFNKKQLNEIIENLWQTLRIMLSALISVNIK